MKNECSTTGCCETETQAKDCCPTQSDCGCPVEKAAGLWQAAFFEAMKQAHVEVLKAKILKAWGPKLDKSADVVLEAMEAQWKAALVKGKAQADLKEKLKNVMTEGK